MALLALSASGYGQAVVSLDHVDGLSGQGLLATEAPLVFHVRLNNQSEYPVAGSTNGFRLYSPDGAEWSPPTADTTALGWDSLYDGGVFMSAYSADGSGSDTIGFGGYLIEGSGLAPDFNSVAFTITTEVDSSQTGKMLCLDSCFYRPVGHWLWAYGPHGQQGPAWDGPHCWEIGACCVGLADDPNGNGSGPDVSDLVFLVTYMFSGGPPPPCEEEVDINGSGDGPNVSDLVYLVTYMFSGGPPPAPCQ
jgi:hypothetical protein